MLLPVECWYFPASHAIQSLDCVPRAFTRYVPALHRMQAVRELELYCPGSQSSQEDIMCPELETYLPASQLWQLPPERYSPAAHVMIVDGATHE